MYLSRVKIDRNNRRKTRDLTHVGAFHHWVEQSFPDELEQGIRTRKLWRLDSLEGGEYLLIVSETKPNLRALEKYGVPHTAESKSYDAFLATITDGMKARFRVTLNPVISVSQGEGKRGRVMPHVTVQQQMRFLQDRSEKNGFRIKETEYSIVERGYSPYHRTGQRPIRLSRATYEGVLTIIDAEKFRKILTEGFGRKKAYGFGLMTIIPVK